MAEPQHITQRELFTLIKSYAHIYHRRFAAEGLEYDAEDLVGEFGITYIDANRVFDKSRGVKFETYLIKAMSTRAAKIRRKLIEENIMMSEIQEGSMSTRPTQEDNLIVRDYAKEITEHLTDFEKNILNEMVTMSAEVQEAVGEDSTSKRFMFALASVYGVNFDRVKNTIRKIQNRAMNNHALAQFF